MLISFKNLEKEYEENILKIMRNRFIRKIGNNKYFHKQYMIYVIGRKII